MDGKSYTMYVSLIGPLRKKELINSLMGTYTNEKIFTSLPV